MRIYALLVAVGLAAVSCKTGPEANGLELWTMSLKPTFTAYMEGVLAQYRKAHPDLPVTWVDVPAAGIENKVLTAIAGGHPPDVVNLNPNFAAKLAEQRSWPPWTTRSPSIKGLYFRRSGSMPDERKMFAAPVFDRRHDGEQDVFTAAGVPPGAAGHLRGCGGRWGHNQGSDRQSPVHAQLRRAHLDGDPGEAGVPLLRTANPCSTRPPAKRPCNTGLTYMIGHHSQGIVMEVL